MKHLLLIFFISLTLFTTACSTEGEGSNEPVAVVEAIPTEAPSQNSSDTVSEPTLTTVSEPTLIIEATEAPVIEATEAPVIEATEAPVTEATEEPVVLAPTEVLPPTETPIVEEEMPVAQEMPVAEPAPTDAPITEELPAPTDTPVAIDTPILASNTEDVVPTPSTTPIPTETPRAHRTPLPFLTPMSTPNPDGEVVHIVQERETVLGIAIQYGVIDNQLIAYNNLGEEAAIRVGDEIRIPVGMMTQSYSSIGGRATSTPMPTVVNENRVILGPFSFDWQKLNNCGPTTTHVMLSYYNIDRPQLTIAEALKPNSGDKNVSPSEIARYVNELGMGTFIGVNGDIELVERLLGAGYPVMVEQWMHYEEGVGHYRAVRGYDREQQKVLQQDTFLGPDIWRPYEDFNYDWSYFNNLYIVIYPPEQEEHVAALIGTDWNPTVMWERALTTFDQQEGAFALYGKAEALHQLGRDAEAVPFYEQAIAAGLPELYFWYNFGYLETLNNIGDYQKQLNFSLPILQAMEHAEDIRFQRAIAFEALGQRENAINELNLAIEDNYHYSPAYAMLERMGVSPSNAESTDTVEDGTEEESSGG